MKELGDYKLVLGLEIHVQPTTKRKMFCRCNADIFEAKPNTHTCPTCLGLPGALPVPNFEAIKKTQILGLALNCKLRINSRFDRKHYFYPDLPKGYQISQYKQPLCEGGWLDLSNGKRAVLERIHLEEDTAKSSHEKGMTLIDFNMSSMPLIELVTAPTFNSVDDAVEFGKEVQRIVRELGVGDADMEKGQMRLEPNISLRTKEMEDNDQLPTYKVEIKNINSFRFMKNAVTAEIIRQRKMLEKGEMPVQENRGYNEASKSTVSQRSKEDAHDYRYFPEPDIPPLKFDGEYFETLKKDYEKLLAETPSHKKAILAKDLDLSSELKLRVVYELEIGNVEQLVRLSETLDSTKLANLMLNSLDYRSSSDDEINAYFEQESNKISDEDTLVVSIRKVLSENKDAVENYKAGKTSVIQFLIGMVMKETKGKADAEAVKTLLEQELNQ